MRKRNPPPDRERPEFFGDRGLGKRVFEALGADGWTLFPMFEVWPRSENKRLDDEIWIPKVTERGWVILSKDEFTKTHEKQVLYDYGARAFSISNQRIKSEVIVERFLANKERIFELAGAAGPYLYSVQPQDLRKVNLP